MSLRVLIVEDDPPTLELMALVLAEEGFEVVPVGDSRDAPEWISTQPFEGILLDVQMPELDGFDLLRLVLQSDLNRMAPVIMVTGNPDRKTMERVFAAGARFFVHKPVDRLRLIGVIRMARGAMFEQRDRRRQVPLCVPVICRLAGQTFQATSLRLGRSAMLLETDTHVPVGSAVGLSFQLPGQSRVLNVAGRVSGTEQKALTVQFHEVSAGDQASLRLFLPAQEEDTAEQVKRKGIDGKP